MPQQLPPLKALHVFEAVARHRSLTKAAQELSVTPSAISQQISKLEDYWGTALVTRTGHGIALTEAADRIFPDLSRGFRHIALAHQTMSERMQARPLRVSVAPSFAARWLVPRLGRYQKRYPHSAAVHIDAQADIKDPVLNEIDLSIRFSDRTRAGPNAIMLLTEDLMAVAAPAFIDKHPVSVPQDLLAVNLLHSAWRSDLSVATSWADWFERCHGISYEKTGTEFSTDAMAIDAVKSAQGVGLIDRNLIADELEKGELVVLFDSPADESARVGYYVIVSENSAANPDSGRFVRWLRLEATASRER